MPLKITKLVLVLGGLLGGFFFGTGLLAKLIFSFNMIPIKLQTVWGVVGIGLLFSLLFALIGYLLAKPLYNLFMKSAFKLENRLTKLPFRGLLTGTLGLVLGLLVALLISTIIKNLPMVGPFVAVLTSILLGYVGASLGYKYRDSIFGLFNTRQFDKLRQENQANKDHLAGHLATSVVKEIGGRPKVLDTSAIIDGRIVDIAKTGFLEGPLVVTQFVLDELRHIADSSDVLRRNRGRRGLDVLNELQTLDINVQIVSDDFKEVLEVDAKLVQLAKNLGGYVVTNDYNLNKVASFQKVRVLNVNELAGAIKLVVLPGETMMVEIVSAGKSAEQGIGYLEDGTMIVVEGGRNHIGKSVKVSVTSVIQTNAGRMVFVKMEDA